MRSRSWWKRGRRCLGFGLGKSDGSWSGEGVFLGGGSRWWTSVARLLSGVRCGCGVGAGGLCESLGALSQASGRLGGSRGIHVRPLMVSHDFRDGRVRSNPGCRPRGYGVRPEHLWTDCGGPHACAPRFPNSTWLAQSPLRAPATRPRVHAISSSPRPELLGKHLEEAPLGIPPTRRG